MDSARKLAWLTFIVSAMTLALVFYQTVVAKRASQKPVIVPVDGGPFKVDIDAATCKANPEYAYVDIDKDGLRRTDRPNHYEVLWSVNFAVQSAASKVVIAFDAKSSKNTVGGNPFKETYEIARAAATASSGRPSYAPYDPNLNLHWAYTIAVLDQDGRPLCPPIDPHICVPGMGGDCTPSG